MSICATCVSVSSNKVQFSGGTSEGTNEVLWAGLLDPNVEGASTKDDSRMSLLAFVHRCHITCCGLQRPHHLVWCDTMATQLDVLCV